MSPSKKIANRRRHNLQRQGIAAVAIGQPLPLGLCGLKAAFGVEQGAAVGVL